MNEWDMKVLPFMTATLWTGIRFRSFVHKFILLSS